jgi:hypothetical protein
MKITFQNQNFIVVDDLLPEDQFEQLWDYFQTEDFEHVHTKHWTPAFRLTDGNPLWGTTCSSHDNGELFSAAIYPTKKAIDHFIGKFISITPDLTELIGHYKDQWDYFFARPYLYPKGTGLSWHTDGKFEISGAYVFYCHPHWNAHWGAELLIDNDPDSGMQYTHKNVMGLGERKIGFHLDPDSISNKMMGYGVGHYILPRPNRLVVLTSQVLHKIKKVEDSAGHNVRASITGFFMKQEKVRNILDSEQAGNTTE